MSADTSERFLVLAPTGLDAPLTCELLGRAGLASRVCDSAAHLFAELERGGAAAIVLTDEVLTPQVSRRLEAYVERQEPWSDLPILLFAGAGASARLRHATLSNLAFLGNVTLLDRPVRPILMLTAAHAALRARRRQYASRAELERQKAEVRQRDEFLAMLGHEIRNPLAGISLAAELLGRLGIGEPHGSRIRRQCRHLAHLIDDLLDVSRVSRGKLALQRQLVQVDELVQRCVDAARPSAEARGLTIVLEGEARAYIDADPVRLEQVVGNLLTNAVKYTSVGGKVTISATADAESITVRVRDDGAGIDPSLLGRIFEPFVQAPGTIDRSEGGLGIGLTLVKGLVELHGGKVGVASDGIGRGSEFTVTLPRLEARVPESTAERCEDSDRQKLRVLVVEDNDDSRALLKSLIEAFGHDVQVAADGIAGVAAALSGEPDVMLVDIGLPGLDGYGVARRVRATARDVRLIAISGYGQPEDRKRAFDAGFDVHCTKPVDVRRLERLLEPRAAVRVS